MGPTAPLLGAVALMVMLSVAPKGIVARVQVTVCPLVEQAQFGPVPLGAVQPAGRVSVTVTLLAGAGPLLRGWIWKVTAAPAIAGELEVTLFWAMRTSAPGITVVLAVAVLSLASGSVTPPTAAAASVAVLVMVPLALLTCATMVMGAIAPMACGPLRVQVTTPALWPQVQPAPLAETKLVDGDKVSVTTRLPESLGPALLGDRV